MAWIETPERFMGGNLNRVVNGQLSIGGRLLLLTILFVIPIVLLQWVFTAHSWREIAFLDRELAGSTYVEEVWPVVMEAARGRSEVARALGGDSRRGADAMRASSEWTRFVSTSDRDRVAAGVALISAVADGSNLTLDRDLKRFYLMDATTVDLPALVAAAHELTATAPGLRDTPARQERSLAAYEGLRAAARAVDDAFAKAIRHNPSPAAREDLARQRRVLAEAVERVMAEGAASGGARRFGPGAEDLLTSADLVWRSAQDTLHGLLRAERQRMVRDLTLSAIGVAISVAAALALAWLIHSGTARRISSIMGAMSRLIEGELNVEVPHLSDTNETGRIARTVLAFKESVVERARLEEESLAATKAKSEFLGNISHEIRTPLNGVVGVASALAHSDLGDDQRAMVELLHRSGLEVERLLSDVLDVSMIESGGLKLELGVFNPARTLEDVVAGFTDRATQKRVALRFEGAEGLDGLFEGDADRLAQVVGKLVSNAVKFTDHGAVTVRARILPSPDGSDRDELRIWVRDTGPGFDEALAPKLFERFTQGDGSISRRYGGSGLGLSICKAIVDMMGGRIEVNSTPGAGSEFRVIVPMRRAAPVAAAPVGAGLAVSGASPRILLVEDHEVNRTVVRMLLAPLGVELVTANDGMEGVRRFEEGRFDLVLMDMQMPVMDGLTATRRIRTMERTRSAPRTQIVMLTANVSPEHRLAAWAAGADAHLAKPIDRERLWSVIMGDGARPASEVSANGQALH